MNRLYTIKEAADILGLTVDYTRDLIRKMQIPTVRLKRNGRPMAITNDSILKLKRRTLDEYIKEKLRILKELHIELTWRQLDHLRGCNTEFEVDAYYHDIITGKTRIK